MKAITLTTSSVTEVFALASTTLAHRGKNKGVLSLGSVGNPNATALLAARKNHRTKKHKAHATNRETTHNTNSMLKEAF